MAKAIPIFVRWANYKETLLTSSLAVPKGLICIYAAGAYSRGLGRSPRENTQLHGRRLSKYNLDTSSVLHLWTHTNFRWFFRSSKRLLYVFRPGNIIKPTVWYRASSHYSHFQSEWSEMKWALGVITNIHNRQYVLVAFIRYFATS